MEKNVPLEDSGRDGGNIRKSSLTPQLCFKGWFYEAQ